MVTLHPQSTAISEADRLTALSATTRDPLWMLARQWQTGALIADDAGSPVKVMLGHATAPLLVDGQPVSGPLEPSVEAEPTLAPDALDSGTRVRLATELVRRISDATSPQVATAVRVGLAAKYPFRPVSPASNLDPMAGRQPDASALYLALSKAIGADGSSGTMPTLPGVPRKQAARRGVERAVRSWMAWAENRLGKGDATAPAHWVSERLAYSVATSVDVPGGTVQLTIDDYDGSGLDWYSFDRSASPAKPTTSTPVSVRPAPVKYAGMPERGYWTFENGNVNLDPLLDQDPARAVLATFAHAYANDWFIVPVEVAPGATLITDLEVTDTFGTTTKVMSTAALDGPGRRWSLWDLHSEDPRNDDGAAGLRVHLPVSPPPLQGPTIEDVLVARDEMANLGWVIELTTRDGDGATVDRYQRWLSLKPPTDLRYRPADAAVASTSYRLGTTMPDHWYPLVAGDAEDGSWVLRLAELPSGSVEVSDAGVRGVVVPHHPGTLMSDEEASRTGTRVRRVDRLIYGPQGPVVWRARTHTAGQGESSSGLRFDTLGAPATGTNLVRNPDFALADRSGRPVTSTKGRRPSLAAEWEVKNVPHGSVRTWLRPTTRPGGTGWMLYVETSKAKTGIVQQWAPRGKGAHQAVVSVWLQVLTGRVRVAAGSGGAMKSDAVSTSLGQWEHLKAPAGKTPVNQVLIQALSPNTVFVVDRVTVRPVEGGTD